MSKSKADFLAMTRSGAAAVAADLNARNGGRIQPEWLQAQMGLETGWGASVLPGTNNPGNIKADANWKGERKTFRVKEYDKNKNAYYTNQDFRVYPSLDDGIKDYGRFLEKGPRYMKAREATTASGFADAMGRSGYATDPYYGAKLKNAIAGINAPADTPMPAGAAPAAAAAGGAVKFSSSHEIVLKYPDGTPAADPVFVTSMGSPRISGTAGGFGRAMR
jgi:flagellum-specific peptidoglycan hydrolase FlgJ